MSLMVRTPSLAYLGAVPGPTPLMEVMGESKVTPGGGGGACLTGTGLAEDFLAGLGLSEGLSVKSRRVFSAHSRRCSLVRAA
jgi:hypothetical protein